MPEKTDFSGKHGKIKGNRYVRGIMKTLNQPKTQIILIILKFLTIPQKLQPKAPVIRPKVLVEVWKRDKRDLHEGKGWLSSCHSAIIKQQGRTFMPTLATIIYIILKSEFLSNLLRNGVLVNKDVHSLISNKCL